MAYKQKQNWAETRNRIQQTGREMCQKKNM